jgi:hypothetical protein
MTKTLTYSLFVVASLIVILLFVTAKTYPQLTAGIVLYPALIAAGFGIFPRKAIQPKIAIEKSQTLNQNKVETLEPKNETTLVTDFDKRAFIKLIGATGISFFLFSLLGRRIEPLIYRRNEQSGINQLGGNDQSGPTGDSPTAGYNISEIDEGQVTYYGFINKDGAWLIMREESDGNSFRYAKGNSDFPSNWANRENLNYDYFNKLS